MKKRLVVLLAFTALSLVLFAGCADGTSSDSSPKSISPPSWIIGTWEDTSSSTSPHQVIFTSDNITDSFWGSFSNLIAVGALSFEQLEKNDSVYKYRVTMEIQGSSQTSTIIFTKVSATELKWEDGSGSPVTYTKK